MALREARQGVPQLPIDHLDIACRQMEQLLPEPRGDGQDPGLDAPHHVAPFSRHRLGLEELTSLDAHLDLPEVGQGDLFAPSGRLE
jgi:hypothetical protein